MCDYSLTEVHSRLACEGEKLVVYKFRTGTIGFANLADTENMQARQKQKGWLRRAGEWMELPFCKKEEECAICIPPGAKLAFEDLLPQFCETHALRWEETAIFDQLNPMVEGHRDYVRFERTGRWVILQQLPLGAKATVVSLQSAGEKKHAAQPLQEEAAAAR